MKKLGWLCTVLVALVAVSGCVDLQAADAEGTFERTLTVNGPVDLDVHTGSGDIQVRPGSDNSVHIIGRIKAHGSVIGGEDPKQRLARVQAQPPVSQTGNTVHIGITGNDPLYNNMSISYEVTVPAHTRVQARSGSGDIGIAMNAAEVEAKTGSGDINVLGASGAFLAQTGSGDVRAGQIAGAMKADTGSGDIIAEQTAPGPVELHTGSGDASLKVSHEGGFTLSIRTGSGSIHTAQPVTSVGDHNRSRLEGTVRGGGPPVEIRTGSGDVTVN